mgnify:CR=1 FL=1
MTDPFIKSLRVSEKRWDTIYKDIAKTRPASWLLLRETMKKKLGFTSRRHREWIPDKGYDGYGNYQNIIFLDFYDDQKKTMFMLKYGPFDKEEIND